MGSDDESEPILLYVGRSMGKVTNERLFERLVAGDQECLRPLMERHGDACMLYVNGYVHDIVVARGYEAEIIPGVTSFSASAAKLGMTLCEGSQSLLVAPAMATDIDAALDVPATKVFMKPGKAVGSLSSPQYN